MAHCGKISVFISYARKDGAALAQRIKEDLENNRSLVWLDTVRISGGASWTVEIERGIDDSHVVLAVMTPGSYVSDICRAEQLRALRKGKTVIPLLARHDADRPIYFETKNYRDFSRPGDYSLRLQELLQDIQTGRDAVVLKERYRQTYVTAPPLPRNYVERREALVSLRNVLIRDYPGPSIALTALRGMGGIGKTILAQALSHDEVLQGVFPDGIVWTTVGKESVHELVARMQEVRLALGDQPGEHETELHCVNRYRNLLREKAVLVIVDDVWRVRDVEPFLAESPRSRILFTTRNAEIAASVGAELYEADLLTQQESRALLARWSGWKEGELPPEAGDLIRECGRLPLALSMTGAMLHGRPAGYWPHVLQLLRDADLARIEAEFPNYPHTDLLRAMQVSVDTLDAQTRRRYVKLAVLLDDMAAPPAIQQLLWGLKPAEALATAERLIGLSLAQRDGDGIRLHDLQLDYVRAQWTDREALQLIHGAMRLSSHVIQTDSSQFVSQILGRLLPHGKTASIREYVERLAAAEPGPWLRPLHPALHPAGTALVRTLEGHSSVVHGVAATADGRRAVSASWDKTLKVWDLEAGVALRTLEGHSDYVTGVAVSADGRRAISASRDKTLKVWDLETGVVLRTLECRSGVRCVALTTDGGRAVSACDDRSLKVWDLDAGVVLRTLKGDQFFVAVTADSRRVVSASRDKTLKVWDLETGGLLSKLKGHALPVAGVAVTADGRRAVSASGDGTLKVWDLESGIALRTLRGHSWIVEAVAVTPDGRLAVSASSDKTLKVWDLESGGMLRSLQGHSGSVYAVAVTADGRRAVSASSDETLKVWDLHVPDGLRMLESHSASVNCVAVTANGGRAVSASNDRTLKVWDLESGVVLCTLEGHSSLVRGVAVTADGRRAVSASCDKTMKVWDLQTGKALRTLEGHSEHVNAVAVTARGRAVSASVDKTLKVWDLETGKVLRTLKGHSSYVMGVALTADGRRAVSAAWDDTLKVWDLQTGKTLRTLEGHYSWVEDVQITADGRYAVSASWDNTLKVWDLETGKAMRTLKGHSDNVMGVAVTANGRYAVSASDDKTLKVWDLKTGIPIATFTCDSAVKCCVFSGHTVIAGDEGGHVHFLALEVCSSS